MPLAPLPADAKIEPLSSASHGLHPLPEGAEVTPLTPAPATTVGGLAGAATRGVAPYAAGAAAGAALGAPFAGVGALPGALAGAGAVGLSQFGEDIYNIAANHFGWPHATTPQEASDRILDKLGIKRAETPVEKSVETTAGMAASLSPMGATWGALGDAVAANRADAAEKFIADKFRRAVKPTVAGKTTLADVAKYDEQARGAIDSIVANKAGLRLTTDAGVTQGQLPKNLEQFGEAIDQTKQAIFQKYDALARAAGNAGAEVSLKPAISELLKIAKDPVILDNHPAIAAYASDWAQRLAARGSYSTVDAQRVVQNLNAKLKAFYRSPTYSDATQANIDSMVANHLRRGLDHAIETASGPGYQQLKNEYGGLKLIEKDVTHRAVMEARKDAGGGIIANMMDAISAEEVIRGVVTLNPAAFLRGTTLKAIRSFMRRMKDPNRAIAKIFDRAEQYAKPRPEATPPAPPLALPPPTLRSPQSPWIRAGEGMIPPEVAGFTTPQPPSGVAPLLRADIVNSRPIVDVPVPMAPLALPRPSSPLALPPPEMLRSEIEEWLRVGDSLIPPTKTGFITPRPVP